MSDNDSTIRDLQTSLMRCTEQNTALQNQVRNLEQALHTVHNKLSVVLRFLEEVHHVK